METNQPTAYEDLGPTRALTSTDRERPAKPPKVSATTQRLIGELGLRYRPSGQADLEAHAAAIALLANDLADIPPAYLERAIAQWVRESPFLPKACELAGIAQGMIRKSTGAKSDPHQLCQLGNEDIAKRGRTDIRWIVVNGQPSLESIGVSTPPTRKDVMDRRGEPMTEDETFELNHRLEELGATARYRADGSRYLVEGV